MCYYSIASVFSIQLPFLQKVQLHVCIYFQDIETNYLWIYSEYFNQISNLKFIVEFKYICYELIAENKMTFGLPCPIFKTRIHDRINAISNSGETGFMKYFLCLLPVRIWVFFDRLTRVAWLINFRANKSKIFPYLVPRIWL